ncbi:PREDICTED: uncharacterized protein LOC106808901 isoform X3 [Priapulus caudatus]|uniref:Uncharacterized protein LOC106808901 isoform X3 n=1 Tax=Priapulus caudatus TaxID=37621 RepID=A0ABM1E528_PRICU|nr:PREDICTED: uncharacterized protein LOC106808901 isoform X3 [Priapulus caudatus]
MEREYVAFMVIKKFPFLADTIGTGIGSWQTAIKHRFKNLRKTKHDPQRAASVTDPKGPQIKRRKVQGVPDLLEGETEETCKEHIKTLKKEMQKTSNKSQALIKELMDITFPYKRQELMETGVLVEDFLNQYPALQFVSEMKAELARITGEKKCYQNNGRQLDSFATQVVKTGREKLHNKINPGQSKGSGSARSREKK